MTMSLSAHQKNQLFDRSQFRAELTLTSQPFLAYRKCLDQAEQLMNQWLREETDIEVLVSGRAWLIDQILILAWEHLVGKKHPEAALLAVGGYGRAELHPGSDIDILLLIPEDNAEPYRDAIEAFLTLLWDINLQVGSSVRSPAECARQAEADLTIISNLIESRLLTGPEALFVNMQQATDTDKMWPAADYLRAKLEEQKARHRKFNQTEYDLEPNLKSSPGGLRDLHMIGWIARRYYQTGDLEKLASEGLLTDNEYQMLIRARNFLWRVRWSLHQTSGRAEDRLLFNHQRTLAEEFGYSDIKGGALAVEQFMQKYFRAVLTFSVLNDLILQHFDDNILDEAGHNFIQPLNDRFQVCDDYLEITHPEVFQNHPPAIIELFVLLSQTPYVLGPTAETIRALNSARALINNDFRNNPEVHRLFLELMRSPYAITASLRRMMRYGILGRFIPEFGRIIGQMQHDLFHSYTVDAHTLLLIKYLRRFNYRDSEEQFPVACRAKSRLPKPELLYLAGLFHDIGKGRGGDHSQLGARDAERFCQQIGLSQIDTALVSWLVEHHLTMSVTAQRQDLSDPETINRFARLVGDSRRLDYLYCLTVADINATNPKLWNSWRASLLRELFRETRRALHRGLENPIDKQERIEETQRQALGLLETRGIGPKTSQNLWRGFEEEYFLRHNAEEVAWQTQGILENPDKQPLILVRETTERRYEGATAVFVFSKDVPYLFAACTTALGELNLTIQDARIISTANGYALDTFIVLDATTGRPLGQNDPARIASIIQHIERTLASGKPSSPRINSNIPRQLKHFSRKPVIMLSNDIANRRTVIELNATDRPGLLAYLGQVFLEQDIEIQKAKVSTLGEKVEDVFFITDSHGQPLTDPDKVKALHRAIHDQLCSLAGPDSQPSGNAR